MAMRRRRGQPIRNQFAPYPSQSQRPMKALKANRCQSRSMPNATATINAVVLERPDPDSAEAKAADPLEMLAPPSTSASDQTVREGDLLYYVIPNRGKVHVINSVNGISRNLKLRFAGCAKSSASNGAIAVAAAGTMAIFNPSAFDWSPGERLVYTSDPCLTAEGIAPTTEHGRSDGFARPMIYPCRDENLNKVLGALIRHVGETWEGARRMPINEETIKDTVQRIYAAQLDMFGAISSRHPLAGFQMALLAQQMLIDVLKQPDQQLRSRSLQNIKKFLSTTPTLRSKMRFRNFSQTPTEQLIIQVTGIASEIAGEFHGWILDHTIGRTLEPIKRGHYGTILL
jgi:hypothetical protein